MHIHFWLLAIFLANGVRCIQNVTIDNTDPSINYQGTWSYLYEGGSTVFVSNDSNANATLIFIGTHD